ncbi:MAG: translation initiation factor IF-2 [Deltaproteobacteria bacterium]|nr:translation initiation factor IF-2 [Deltaproteobacteria bacterium]
MAKTRVINLAKEMKIDVRDLLTHMREVLGLSVENYLSSLDESTAEQVRLSVSQLTPKVEEKRIGDNVMRRRKVAPTPVKLAAVPPPEVPAAKAPEKAVKSRRPKEPMAVVVALPAREQPAVEAPPPEPETLAPPGIPPTEPAEPGPSAAPAPATTMAESAGEPAAAPPPVQPPPPPPATSAKVAAPSESGAPVKRLRSKLKRKDTPARIISLPTEAPPKPSIRPTPTRPAGEAAPPPAAPSTARPSSAARPPTAVRPPSATRPPGESRPAAEVKTAPGAKKPEAKGKKKGKETVEIPGRSKPGKKREVWERVDLYGGAAEGQARVAGKKKGVRKAFKKVSPAELSVPKAIKRRIKVGDSITVGDLAKRMGIKSGEVIKQLLGLGVIATINYPIDYESAVIVANEFGYEVERATILEEELIREIGGADAKMEPRPPVVTIMGHVDHGKTSLLDAIRESRITEGEAGGITQHIGAYHVTLPDHGEVVFLDTPGHEAFTAMRARGAQVTDLVVLVVAADDGVMEQTQEAINHARAAGVPLVVAVNKIDKPNANPERVKRELANLGVVLEDWGGDVQYAEVSAKQRVGIPELLEKILLQAEVLELKAAVETQAQGRIIESRLDKGRGPVGTVLVQQGTLKQGDYFVCGQEYGRVRALFDDQGKRIEKVTPGLPAEVQGFSGVPEAGDEFLVLEERKARQIAMMRQQKQREAALARLSRVSLEKLYQQIKEGMVKELKLVLKADVHGSIEALTKYLAELGTSEIKVYLIHTGIGDVTESDIMLASASDAIVVGFNVKANPKAHALAESEQVDLRFYNIIYNLMDDIRAAMEGMLEPIIEEKVMGQAEVRQVFTISKVGTIAGCMVRDGKMERNALARVRRQGQVVFEGARINSLKRFKDDVKEVLSGYECGIGLDKFSNFQTGDVIEAYVQEKVKAQLDSSPREVKRD